MHASPSADCGWIKHALHQAPYRLRGTPIANRVAVYSTTAAVYGDSGPLVGKNLVAEDRPLPLHADEHPGVEAVEDTVAGDDRISVPQDGNARTLIGKDLVVLDAPGALLGDQDARVAAPVYPVASHHRIRAAQDCHPCAQACGHVVVLG